MKQYKIELWVKGGFGGFEGCIETKVITCKKLIKKQGSQNVVYADGRKIEFNHSEIVNISVKS